MHFIEIIHLQHVRRVNIMVYMYDAFDSHLQIEYVRRVNVMVYMYDAFYRDHSFTTCA